MMKDFQWKKSNYKQLNGKWKIGVLLEAGYKECNVLVNQENLIKITERIYFQNLLLSYPKSEQLLQNELENWCQGIRFVSEQIERSRMAPYIIISIRNIQFSICNMQDEAFIACSMQWASEMFEFPLPEINVYFDESLNYPNGKYVYDFVAKK